MECNKKNSTSLSGLAISPSVNGKSFSSIFFDSIAFRSNFHVEHVASFSSSRRVKLKRKLNLARYPMKLRFDRRNLFRDAKRKLLCTTDIT